MVETWYSSSYYKDCLWGREKKTACGGRWRRGCYYICSQWTMNLTDQPKTSMLALLLKAQVTWVDEMTLCPTFEKQSESTCRERMAILEKSLKVMSWQMWEKNYRCLAGENMKTFFYMYACLSCRWGEKLCFLPQEDTIRTSAWKV